MRGYWTPGVKAVSRDLLRKRFSRFTLIVGAETLFVLRKRPLAFEFGNGPLAMLPARRPAVSGRRDGFLRQPTPVSLKARRAFRADCTQAADRFGDGFGGLSVRAGADNLRSAQGKSVGGTQSVVNVRALGLRQSANSNRGLPAFVLLYQSALRKGFGETALEIGFASAERSAQPSRRVVHGPVCAGWRAGRSWPGLRRSILDFGLDFAPRRLVCAV